MSTQLFTQKENVDICTRKSWKIYTLNKKNLRYLISGIYIKTFV